MLLNGDQNQMNAPRVGTRTIYTCLGRDPSGATRQLRPRERTYPGKGSTPRLQNNSKGLNHTILNTFIKETEIQHIMLNIYIKQLKFNKTTKSVQNFISMFILN